MNASQFKLENGYNKVQTQYGMFLKLSMTELEMKMGNMMEQYMVYKDLMTMPTVRTRFNSLKKQRFLVHLICHHKLLSNNQFDYAWSNDEGNNFGENGVLAIIASLFNHSCYPDIVHFSYRNKMGFTTIRPVRKGQQLFIKYHRDLSTDSVEERQKFLQNMFNFRCKCSKCVPTSLKNVDSMAIIMQQDPIYQDIIMLYEDSNAEHSALIEKCYQFMRKYGHLPYTEPGFNVYLVLSDCLNINYLEKRANIF